ncbi:MAG TPA: cytidylate kinase family protein, partial [Gemmatimonadales bacterium]|nr:cytidylate kinase family protein [Gemmatimonadales bacterium]
MVAQRLPGWTLIDNEFVEQVARLAGLPKEEVARREERTPGLLERLARTLAVGAPEMFIATGEHQVPVDTAEEETVVKTTERVIAEAATEGRVILVGRGAQAVLATRP